MAGIPDPLSALENMSLCQQNHWQMARWSLKTLPISGCLGMDEHERQSEDGSDEPEEKDDDDDQPDDDDQHEEGDERSDGAEG